MITNKALLRQLRNLWQIIMPTWYIPLTLSRLYYLITVMTVLFHSIIYMAIFSTIWVLAIKTLIMSTFCSFFYLHSGCCPLVIDCRNRGQKKTFRNWCSPPTMFVWARVNSGHPAFEPVPKFLGPLTYPNFSISHFCCDFGRKLHTVSFSMTPMTTSQQKDMQKIFFAAMMWNTAKSHLWSF